MAKKRNSTSALKDEALYRMYRRTAQSDELRALNELNDWLYTWKHTEVAAIIRNLRRGRRARGPAFDVLSIVETVVFLEILGVAGACRQKGNG